MRIVIQRVAHASVTIDGKVKSSIGPGLLILVGIEDADETADAEWLSKKAVNLRIFDDENGVMNRSVGDIDGEILIVSQFTLFASTRKGNRPLLHQSIETRARRAPIRALLPAHRRGERQTPGNRRIWRRHEG